MSSLPPIPVAPKPQVTLASTPGLSIPLPPKLLKRILDLEFIDMIELMPESNQGEEQPRRSAFKGPIMDIQVWLECYLVAVLSMRHPDKL